MFDKNKYANDYVKNHYDVIKFSIPKGCKEELKQLSADNGFSNVSQFIISTLEDTYFIDLHTKRKQKDK